MKLNAIGQNLSFGFFLVTWNGSVADDQLNELIDGMIYNKWKSIYTNMSKLTWFNQKKVLLLYDFKKLIFFVGLLD